MALTVWNMLPNIQLISLLIRLITTHYFCEKRVIGVWICSLLPAFREMSLRKFRLRYLNSYKFAFERLVNIHIANSSVK